MAPLTRAIQVSERRVRTRATVHRWSAIVIGLASLSAAGWSANAATPSAVVALGPGWGPVESFQGATFRWEGQDAQIVVRGAGIATVTLDAEAGPGIGRSAFLMRALTPDGRQTDAATFSGHSTVAFYLPASPAGAVYRLHVDGADGRVAGSARVLDYRVFAVSSPNGPLLLPEIAEPPVRVDGGWYPLEAYAGEVFRWVDDDARFHVAVPAARRATLRLLVEPGPALAGAPLALTVLQNGRAIRTLHLTARTALSLPVRLVAGTNAFALRTRPGPARVAGDARTLDFRVFSLQVR